jgi:hypothetical protein
LSSISPRSIFDKRPNGECRLPGTVAPQPRWLHGRRPISRRWDSMSENAASSASVAGHEGATILGFLVLSLRPHGDHFSSPPVS